MSEKYEPCVCDDCVKLNRIISERENTIRRLEEIADEFRIELKQCKENRDVMKEENSILKKVIAFLLKI